ncbi:uncharacterized protein IAS62_002503 [Cryptococcus decagattii]|uniref:Protein AF-9 homolog n=1 Tax=Cryptococcus decagattii TaxID=1859122 RepID=A0ABZ2AVJ0_9TREE
MSNERVRGIQVHRPIIYGSHARLLTEAERQLAPAGHTHQWTVFLNSAASPPLKQGEPPDYEDIDYLPGGADDLSYFIRKVTFKLHETYATPNRVIEKPPYRVSETGWGEFTVQIRIQFIPESSEKPLNLQHSIKLHHWGAPVEPLPAISATLTPDPAPTESNAEIKLEPDTPAPLEESVTPAPTIQQPTSEPATNEPESKQGTPAPPGGDTTEQIKVDVATPTLEVIEPSATPAPLSFAAKLPIHAWQYDEIVFSDPPRQFLDILNAHPPTPLPAKSRRPRDQREDYEARKKNKSAVRGASVTVSARASRAGTVDTGAAGTPAPAQIGIPGEPGSADVPFEFTQEMLKGEHNAMLDARVKIVEQMDRWRERLIALEKELAKAKEDVKATAAM